MLYFKNSELTSTYRVALNTVLNWIKAAQAGKLEIELIQKNGRNYIANTARNVQTLEKLVVERKKYRNSRTVRTVVPTKEFYRVYNKRQVLDIATSLDVNREIPRQYNYFQAGAHNWDRYAIRLYEDDAPNIINSTIKLLENNYSYIDSLLEPYEIVNLVDVGVGNALPIRGLIEHLLVKGKFGRYIGLDISPEMLTIAQSNIKAWFGDKVVFEGHQIDMSQDRFSDILAEENLSHPGGQSINIVALLGGTPDNLLHPDDAYRTIRDSMTRNDILLHSDKLNTEQSRRFFDFNASTPKTSTSATLSTNHRMMFDLMDVDPLLYTTEMGYDPANDMRYIRVRLNVTLRFCFKLGDNEDIVEVEKGETILLWRAWGSTSSDLQNQLIQSGISPIHVSQTRDREYMLTIAQLSSVRTK